MSPQKIQKFFVQKWVGVGVRTFPKIQRFCEDGSQIPDKNVEEQYPKCGTKGG